MSLPNNWKLVSLDKIAAKEKGSIRRGPFGGSLKKDCFVPDGYKVYQQKNAIEDDFNAGSYFIDEKKYKELEGFSIQPNDLIISCAGTIGRIAIVPKDAKPGVINQALMRLRPNTDVILPIYLKRVLESPKEQRDIFGQASGTALKNLAAISEIKKSKIPLPPLEEQRRIAAILDKADEVRRKRQEAIRLTEELLRSLFLDMFGDPVTNPKGWKVVELGILAHVTDGTHKTPCYVEQGIPFSSAKNSRANESDWINTRFIMEAEHKDLIRRCHPEKGDVVLTKSGTIGEAAVIDRDLEFSLFESVALLKLKNNAIHPLILTTLLNEPCVRSRYKGDIKGVAVKHLHLVDIRRLQIILPPVQLQEKFLTAASVIQDDKDKLVGAENYSNNLFNSLLQRAFRGEL